jgi:amino-acid N-acetyltransferase
MAKKTVRKKTKKNKAPQTILRPATVNDAKQIQAIVLHYSNKKEMLPRSLNEIYENIRDFTVVEKKGKLLACGALHVCWSDLAEVKSLATAPRNTHKGYGARIVRNFLKQAPALGVSRLFVLTFQPDFFEKLGFQRVEMDELPKKVWTECIKCVHFPNCDEKALVIDL